METRRVCGVDVCQPTWRDMVEGGYGFAESLHLHMIELGKLPFLNSAPVFIDCENGRTRRTEGTIEQTIERLEANATLLDLYCGRMGNLFTRMNPILEYAATELQTFSLPPVQIDLTWRQGGKQWEEPRKEYPSLFLALQAVRGWVHTWGIGLPEHYRKASEFALKAESERTATEQHMIDAYQHRSLAFPYSTLWQSAIAKRIQVERGRMRRDLANGCSDSLPLPAIDLLYDNIAVAKEEGRIVANVGSDKTIDNVFEEALQWCDAAESNFLLPFVCQSTDVSAEKLLARLTLLSNSVGDEINAHPGNADSIVLNKLLREITGDRVAGLSVAIQAEHSGRDSHEYITGFSHTLSKRLVEMRPILAEIVARRSISPFQKPDKAEHRFLHHPLTWESRLQVFRDVFPWVIPSIKELAGLQPSNDLTSHDDKVAFLHAHAEYMKGGNSKDVRVRALHDKQNADWEKLTSLPPLGTEEHWRTAGLAANAPAHVIEAFDIKELVKLITRWARVRRSRNEEAAMSTHPAAETAMDLEDVYFQKDLGVFVRIGQMPPSETEMAGTVPDDPNAAFAWLKSEIGMESQKREQARLQEFADAVFGPIRAELKSLDLPHSNLSEIVQWLDEVGGNTDKMPYRNVVAIVTDARKQMRRKRLVERIERYENDDDGLDDSDKQQAETNCDPDRTPPPKLNGHDEEELKQLGKQFEAETSGFTESQWSEKINREIKSRAKQRRGRKIRSFYVEGIGGIYYGDNRTYVFKGDETKGYCTLAASHSDRIGKKIASRFDLHIRPSK